MTRHILLRRLFCCAAVLTTALHAALPQSPFTQLDWNALRIDSVLPTYTEVIPLETDCRLYDYSVRLSYAEWAPLDSRESQVASRFDGLLADTLRMHTFVGTSRRQGMLDLSFVPIVRREGRYMKLLSCKIEVVAEPKAANRRRASRRTEAIDASSRYAATSVLASGRWLKAGLTEDGLIRITDEELRTRMGFTNPANIHVYGYGGHRLPELLTGNEWDDLEEVPLLRRGDGYLFFANGLTDTDGGHHTLNHYAREAYYFITQDERPALTITEEAAPDVTPAVSVSTFSAVAFYDPQEYAWFSGGRQLFESYNYANGNSRQYTLTLPSHIPAGSATGQLTVAFSAANKTETTVSTTVNGTEAGIATISALSEYYSAMLTTRRYSVDIQPTTTVQLTSTRGNTARLNYLELTYDGLLRIDDDFPVLHFSHTAEEPSTLDLEYADGQQPQLWRLSEPGRPAVALATSAADYTATDGTLHRRLRAVIDGDGEEHRYVAFDAATSRYTTFQSVAAVENQDLHAQTPIDMLIITPASGIFDSEAERLAEAHRAHDSLRVAVVRADRIYNEFSSGTPDATAYRRFLKMLYDRAADASDAPRYLLLFGDCAWDNRMLTSAWLTLDPDNFLLAFESENSTSDTRCYVMEDYFGLLDDGEGVSLTEEKVDLGVGRFPVRTLTQARQLVDKTIGYLEGRQVGAWKNVIAMLGDDGTRNEDGNIHMEYCDSVARVVERLHPESEVRKIMWDTYPRLATATGYRYPQAHQAILSQIEEGALMFNYTGHAAAYTLSHEQVLRIEDFAEAVAPRPALWVTAACDVMPFDTQTDNIGETAILNPTGMAVAFFGTARTVYANSNLNLNRMFCEAVLGSDADGRPNRIGDAVRESKVRVISGRLESGNYENKLHYALLGDPALRMGSVENHVVIDSIDGHPVSALPADFTLRAGARVRFAGHIADAAGEPIDAFDGTLTGRLYDSESTVTCRNNDRLPSAFQFRTYDKLLYTGSDSIARGRFSLVCPIPIDIKYSDQAGRLVLYAISDDLRTEANGYCEDFTVGGTAATLDDTRGPDITAYLDSDDFSDGATVGPTPYFVALLHDESGINYSGNGLGHDLELIIDNTPATTYTLNDCYTGVFGDYSQGSVAFSIPALGEGPHSLLFRAWDMLNNYSTATLSFNVDPAIETSILSLTATNSPATTQTQFLLHYDRPGSLCEFVVEVFDYSGRLLWTHTESGSSSNGIYAITWNLTTGSGFPLGSGIYLYRARVTCGDSREVSKTQKIIINRRR